MKTIVSVQDISCFGKCALTLSLPVLSAMGLETSVLPTALLSTHTAYPNAVIRRNTALGEITAHWQTLGLSFDAILSGYLGSTDQLDALRTLWRTCGTAQTLRAVDPVMGDHGKLYRGFSADFVREMRSLCAEADLIMPNLTEAGLLLEEPTETVATPETAVHLLPKLCKLGCRIAVLTGVTDGARQGAMAYDARTNTFSAAYAQTVPLTCHGTGDLFASVLTGSITRGEPLSEALALAVSFTAECIRATQADGAHSDTRRGVCFEPCLPMLFPKNA